jgi:30S ribosomal protein S31
MGKGDKKTKKGKIAMGSYGKTRPHNLKKAEAATADTEKSGKATAKKPSA